MAEKYQCNMLDCSVFISYMNCFLKIPIYMWSLTSKTDTGQRRQTGCKTANESQLLAYTFLGEAHVPSNQKTAAMSLTFPQTFFHSPRCQPHLTRSHFLIPAEGRVQYLRHFWSSSQEAHVQSAPEIVPCDAGRLTFSKGWDVKILL